MTAEVTELCLLSLAEYLSLLLLLSPLSASGRTDPVWVLESSEYIEQDVVRWGTLVNCRRESWESVKEK